MSDVSNGDGDRFYPIINLGRRVAQLVEWSNGGRGYPVYGGFSLADGELTLTVYGPSGAAEVERLGRFLPAEADKVVS